MKRWIALVLLAALAVWQAPSQAQGRVYNQAELDALLAPIALYPDPLLSHILVAATYPDDLREAAAWSRANYNLSGEDAVRAAEPMPWHPSVKALVAFPDLLARMGESPQWTADLAAAFLEQEPYVMDTVQGLRQRAQASGSLQSNDQYSVQQQGSSIAVYPAQPQVVYVPYYDPYVVYGPWWWPAYRPVFWQPWFARPAVFVSTRFFVTSVDWRHRHVVRHAGHNHAAQSPRPSHWRNDDWRWREAHRARIQPATQPGRSEARREFQRDRRVQASPPVVVQNHAGAVRPLGEVVRPMGDPVRPIGIPVRPIVDSVRIPQPAAQPGRSEARREFHRDRRAQAQASPPVIVHGQTQALRPIVDPVRTHQQLTARAARPQVRSEFQHAARPMGQSGHARQPPRQVEQRRR
jgi:Protein of unknown function (DUF3300)